MKQIWLILLCLLLPFVMYARERYKKQIFGIAAGTSIPLSNYAGTKNEKDGYANQIYFSHFTIGYSHLLAQKVGITSMLTTSTHDINAEALLDYYFPDRPDFSGGYVVHDTWRSSSVFGGVLFTLPGWIADFEIRGLIGAAYNKKPNINLEAIYYSDLRRIKLEETWAMAFTCDIGTGFKFAINDYSGISINIDYMFTNPVFKVTTITDRVYEDTRRIRQHMHMLNISVGVYF